MHPDDRQLLHRSFGCAKKKNKVVRVVASLLWWEEKLLPLHGFGFRERMFFRLSCAWCFVSNLRFDFQAPWPFVLLLPLPCPWLVTSLITYLLISELLSCLGLAWRVDFTHLVSGPKGSLATPWACWKALT